MSPETGSGAAEVPSAATPAREGSPGEILGAISKTLMQYPGRTDLWLMRFDIFRTLGLKSEFAASVLQAWNNPVLKRNLDWFAVRCLWKEMTLGEKFPHGIRIADKKPKSGNALGAEIIRPARRFSDIALQVAGPELEKMAQQYEALRSTPAFYPEFARSMTSILRRPTPLHHAQAISRSLGGTAQIYFKRDDLRKVSLETEIAAAHAHLAEALGKRILLTGNDVDAYSVALAAMSRRFGMGCMIVMRPGEPEAKPELVTQLRRLNARIEPISAKDLKSSDPREAALRVWQRNADRCHLALSFGSGPRPYPTITSDFQSLLGRETALQLSSRVGDNRPRTYIAAVHSEADSIGFMLPHLSQVEPELIYAETDSSVEAWQASRRLAAYNDAIREHAWLRAAGRITHVHVPDVQAEASRKQAAALENITLGFEDARALALASMLVHRDFEERDIVVLLG